MNTLIKEEGYQPEQTELLGSKLLIGNGYLGCRGTLEEYGAQQLCALTLAGLFDRNGAQWREPVNAPNPFAVSASFGGCPLSVLKRPPTAHSQWVDISCACQGRETEFSGDGRVRVTSRRFISLADRHVMALCYEVTSDRVGEARLTVGPDCTIWDINGPHLVGASLRRESDACLYTARTVELGTGLALAQTVRCPGGDLRPAENGVEVARNLGPGETLRVTVFAALYKSTDPDTQDPARSALDAVRHASELGFEALLAQSRTAWDRLWAQTAVTIRGDDAADLALRYSMYLLLVSTPFHTDRVAIPARGLSGQVYKGAMFWDTELYMLPMYLASLPEVAGNLVRYRIHTLEGAREKAREYGYRGAFYAWESQEDGQDGCTEYNINDIFTGRPLRTYFRDKQIHISADVAYGIWEYFCWSGDERILTDGGAEVLIECARFLYSWSHFKSEKGRYELLDVTGADEYHERVSNDFYTNVMAKKALEALHGALEHLAAHQPAFLADLLMRLDYQADEAALSDFEARLYLPKPNANTGLIEQYDGHFGMEDISPEKLAERILNPNEYLGSPVGLAVQTQVIKQADVCLVTALFPNQFSPTVRRANFRYYEPRTEHGSSLSGCIYALAAAKCGLGDYAYDYFMRAATLDLAGAYKRYVGDLYIGGTHPAANGGSWLVAIRGFGGLSLDEAGLHLEPTLPAGWEALSFPLCYQGQRCRVSITQRQITVTAEETNSGDIPLFIGAKPHRVLPGATAIAAYRGGEAE